MAGTCSTILHVLNHPFRNHRVKRYTSGYGCVCVNHPFWNHRVKRYTSGYGCVCEPSVLKPSSQALHQWLWMCVWTIHSETIESSATPVVMDVCVNHPFWNHRVKRYTSGYGCVCEPSVLKPSSQALHQWLWMCVCEPSVLKPSSQALHQWLWMCVWTIRSETIESSATPVVMDVCVNHPFWNHRVKRYTSGYGCVCEPSVLKPSSQALHQWLWMCVWTIRSETIESSATPVVMDVCVNHPFWNHRVKRYTSGYGCVCEPSVPKTIESSATPVVMNVENLVTPRPHKKKHVHYVLDDRTWLSSSESRGWVLGQTLLVTSARFSWTS